MPTTTCQQTRQLISDAIDLRADGQSSPFDPAAENHLANCGDCVRFRDDVHSLDSRLARPVSVVGSDEPEMPADLHERIMATVRAAGAESKVIAFPKWLAPAIGVAAAVAIAFLLMRGGEGPGSEGTGIASVPPAPAPLVGERPGLPTGFDIPIDIAAIPAAAERQLTSAFTKEADAMASDAGKVRDFFASRFSAVGRIGL